MKSIKFTNLMVLGLVVAMAACGCKKNPVGVTRLPGSTAGKPTDTTRANPVDTSVRGNSLPTDGSTVGSKPVDTTYGIAPNAAGSHEGWIEDVAALKADTVYFDFDSAVVKSSEKSKVSAVADYLKAHPSAAVRVEGNCDARGTEEYNRALGERRALAVREELVGLGIAPSAVDTISYGKDRPADPGNDETAWKANRRDDFVVLTPPVKP
jgi:peptidoglycan-associated lipoprotein